MTMLRIVVGHGTAMPTDILLLAAAVASEAQRYGLGVVANRASHQRGSPSRYITLRDHAKRHWLIRVSNHRRPESRHATPHLDLVSLDGKAGLFPASQCLRSIAEGKARWFDPDRETRRTHGDRKAK